VALYIIYVEKSLCLTLSTQYERFFSLSKGVRPISEIIEMTQVKAVYEAPTVAKVGDFETTTQNTGTGGTLDASFPVGTPFADLTFS
jgi:hypothetical protein